MSRPLVLFRWGLALLVVILGIFGSLDLRLKEDAVDLLPGEAVRGDIRQLQRLGLVDRVFITLSVDDSRLDRDQARRLLHSGATLLGGEMAGSGLFSHVLARLPAGYEAALFSRLQSSLPALLDEVDRLRLVEMTTPAGIAAGLARTFAMLNGPGSMAMKKQAQVDPLGFTSLLFAKLQHLRASHAITIDDGYFMSRDGRSCLVAAESRLPLTNRDNGLVINSLLQRTAATLAPQVTLRVIGSLPHTLANSDTVKKDLRLLLPLASVLLLLLLLLSLRSLRALAVFAVPFLAAPPAIALTRLFYGEPTGLALGFGIVLLGIAVDFSVHLYLALSEGGRDRAAAMAAVARPMVFAAATTMAVFIVLLFSEVVSHRQMALLALFGVAIALALTWLVVPTVAVPCGDKDHRGFALKTAMPRVGGGKVFVLCWLALLVGGAFSWPHLRYNGDLRALDVPNARVMADERHFAATWGESGEQAFVVAEGDSLSAALDGNARVARFLRQAGFTSFQSFAPLLPGPTVQEEHLSAWRELWATLRPAFDTELLAAAREMGFADTAFAPFWAWLDEEPKPVTAASFLDGPLQPLFATMLRPGGDGGGYLAMTTVAVDAASLPGLLRFAEEEQGIHVLAALKWRGEVERLLKHDIVSLSLTAALAIALLVSLQFRNLRAVLAVLAPVLAALAAMLLYCRFADGQLNMMHLIMGIMVIGLCVDYGIFIVCACQRAETVGSARAVTICALSTLIGFGVLAFATHPALHALGVTVLVGIGASLPTALLVSPALLALGKGGGR